MKKFKEYLMFIKRRYIIKKNFLDCSNYLRPGTYKFSESMKYLYIDEPDIKSRCYKLFHRKFTNKYISFIRKIVFFLFFNKHININYGDKNFQGQVYLPGNIGNCSLSKKAKIFDFNMMQLVEIFDSKDEMEFKIKSYNHFSKYYNVPLIVDVNYINQHITEELIYDEKSRSDVNDILLLMLQKQILYTRGVNPKCLSHINAEKLNNASKEIKILTYYDIEANMEKDISDFSEVLVQCIQHGDLWFENVLISKNIIYLIDYEHSGYYLFFYDFFSFILHEHVNYYNKKCIDDFINGKYDYLLECIFGDLNVTYNPKLKAEYFSLFILYRKTITCISKKELREYITIIKYIKEKS